MTDINQNVGADKLSKVSNLNFEGSKATPSAPKNYTEKEIKNLDNAHSALVGRSMIKKMQKADATQPAFNGQTVENVKADLSFLSKNPALVSKATAVFEAALAKGYDYAKATAIMQEFVDSYK